VRLIFPAASGPRDIARRDLAELYDYPPSPRPWVRANMVTSADGAATIGGRSGGLSSGADRSVFALLRTLSDVILVGAGTARAERYAAVKPDELWPDLRHDRPVTPAIAVVSRRLSLDLASPLVAEAPPDARTILITTEEAPAGVRAEAAKKADVVVAGEYTVDLKVALHALAERGYPRILAEGGPQLLGQLTADRLLDELCLTISPLVASGGAGRIAVGTSMVQSGQLELKHVIEEDGYLLCRYMVQRPAIA
jgi:riboflavin biosynthesis pyrimidine reductase